MKKVFIVLFIICSLFSSNIFAKVKKYEIKSAKIIYNIEGNGNVMGMDTKITGEGELYFKNYGQIEIRSEKTAQTIMGQKEIQQDLTKIEEDTVYSVDFEDKVIYKHNISDESIKEMLKDTSEETLINLGAKKIGKDNVAGFSCTNWLLMGSEICVYKGIPLKSKSTLMGITYIQEAKDIKLNISIDDSKFNLPNYPIRTASEVMQEQMKNLTPEQKQMMQQMMQNMGQNFGNTK